MEVNELWKFNYKVKDFPDSARLHFLENTKSQIVASVKDTLSGGSRGILDVEGTISGDTISIRVVDLRSKEASKWDNSSGFFNTKNESEFFNIINEDEFRNRIQDSAKKVHTDLLRLLLESKAIFSNT